MQTQNFKSITQQALALFATVCIRSVVPILALTILTGTPLFAQIKKTKHMEKGIKTAKVKTFNLGAASEHANNLISQAYSVNGTIYISGQYSHDTTDAVTGVGDFAAQVRQTLKNIDRVLAGFNVTKSNIADMTVYLTNPPEQSAPLVPLLQEYMGKHRPAATVIGVTGLWYPEQLIEIRVVAHTN
ncbi:MAG: RidA family protein [Mucilaginibacter sp.]|uniref:RidA family protein n=1 Tax=Mucilaginibacter sp. TaxID=1882438 RepID=UPI00356B3E5E